MPLRRQLPLIVAALVLLAAPASAPAAVRIPTHVERLGSSAQGRPINAVVRGFPSATRNVLVIGVVHGNEPAGLAIVRALRYAVPPPGVRYWLVAATNPDGLARGSRQNARGVDLNRNFPGTWLGGGHPWDVFYPGRVAGSEPETRAIMALVQRVRPNVTIWYHQHLGIVVKGDTYHARQVGGRYAKLAGMPLRAYFTYHGTASSWQVRVAPTSAPLVVELPTGTLDAKGVRRHLRAVRDVATR